MRIFLFILTLLLLSGIAGPVLAQTGFNLLAPIQGINPTGDFATYLSAIFRIGIGVAAFLAIIMIAIGGFEYMGSDAVFSKEKGRERITAAILGLLLILFSVAILYTINPAILSLQISGKNLEPIINNSSSTGGSVVPTNNTGQYAPQQTARQQGLIEYSKGCGAAGGTTNQDLNSYTCSKESVVATQPIPGNIQQNNAAYRQFSSEQCAGGTASVENGNFICTKTIIFDRQPK